MNLPFLGGNDIPPPPTPPPPPQRSDAEVREASRQERLRRSKATGRASTILTSGQGVTPDDAGKKLLGG